MMADILAVFDIGPPLDASGKPQTIGEIEFTSAATRFISPTLYINIAYAFSMLFNGSSGYGDFRSDIGGLNKLGFTAPLFNYTILKDRNILFSLSQNLQGP